MVSCDVICDLMPVYASGQASSETERLVEEHLAQCPACREAFGQEEALDEALGVIESAQEPSNGGRVITRTRRLLFVIGVSTLTLLACLLVTMQRLLMQGMAVFSFPRLPGPSLAWLALAGAVLALYVVLLLWRRGRDAGSAVRNFALSLLTAAPLLVLALVVYQLAGTGGVLILTLAGLFLAIALGVTFGFLPQIPYATLTTVLVLLLVSGLLVVQVAAGVVPQLALSCEMPGQLGHPPEGVSADEAARVDLTPLDLMWKETKEPTWLNNVWIGPEAEAARAVYEGEQSCSYLTVVRFQDPQRAGEFFVAWNEAVSESFELLRCEINLPGLPGQGHSFQAYEPAAQKAYSGWQNGSWVTVVEVPGPDLGAMLLAREIRETVAKAYQG